MTYQSAMTSDLYRLAVDGDIEALCTSVTEAAEADDSGGGPEEALFQWLQVAATLGSEEADEMAADIYEAALSGGGDEVVEVLHYEVAQWFIRGQNGIARNSKHGLAQLQRAQELQLRESVDLDKDLLSLRDALDDDERTRFDEIFPGLAE